MKIKGASWSLFVALLAFGLFAFVAAPPAAAHSSKKGKTHTRISPNVEHGFKGGGHESHSGGLPARDVPAIMGAVVGTLGVISALNAAPARPLAGPPPAGPYWYWCDASRQYYPYVGTCASGWRPVRPR